MKVGLVAHSDAPWTGHYCRCLRDAGHDVVVLSFCPDPIPGERVEFIGARPYNPASGKHLIITRALRIRRILKRFGADVVFAPYLISNGLAAALGWQGPLVISAMGADVVQQARRRQRTNARRSRIGEPYAARTSSLAVAGGAAGVGSPASLRAAL